MLDASFNCQYDAEISTRVLLTLSDMGTIDRNRYRELVIVKKAKKNSLRTCVDEGRQRMT